jgi:hypothetical protein
MERMAERYESWIDRQIRLAQERGEFDDLPGSGQPISGAGEHYDAEWWIKDLIQREKLSGLAPATLGLRKEVENIESRLAALKSEQGRAGIRRRPQRAHRQGEPWSPRRPTGGAAAGRRRRGRCHLARHSVAAATAVARAGSTLAEQEDRADQEHRDDDDRDPDRDAVGVCARHGAILPPAPENRRRWK